MATPPLSKELDWSNREAYAQPAFKRMAILNGLLIGLALATGAWASDILLLLQLPVQSHYPSLLIGGLMLCLTGLAVGWLTGRWVNSILSLLLWTLAAGAATLIIGYQPTLGRNIAVWLIESRLWGTSIYPTLNAPLVSLFFTGFAVFIVLGVLAILQNYRLDGIVKELGASGRLSRRSTFMLLWPLIFVAMSGWITNNIVGDKSTEAADLVKAAIDTSRNFEGDLFELGRQKGINYAALEGVRDQLGAEFSLIVGGVDPNSETTFIVARFDDGAWITCRVIAGQLNFCYDAAPPYTIGLSSLITGQSLSEDCRGCLPQVEEQWQAWLNERSGRLGDDPQIERLAQYGGHVIMRASSLEGDSAVECQFSGMAPVQLVECWEE